MAQAKKKKKFFDVEIPTVGITTQIQAYGIEELNGKYIKYDLTRFLKGKSVVLTLNVKVEDNKAIASPKKIELMPYFIRRMIRKGTNHIEDSFDAKCKDSLLRVKPLLVTRRKVSREVRKTLRNESKKEILEFVQEKGHEEIFEEVLKNQLQKRLNTKLKKIYPLALCEIRVLETKEKQL